MSEDKKVITEQDTIFESANAAEKADKKKAAKKTTTATKKKTAKKANKTEEEKFKFPFKFQFGPQILPEDQLEQKLGFVKEQEYTKAEIKQKLSRAIAELQIPDASVEYIKDSNTFVLSNVLKKKGATQIKRSSLMKIEDQFMETYLQKGTEERALVYRHNYTREERIVFPDIKKTSVSLEGSPDLFYNHDTEWPLIADLHSHHVMSSTPSEIDNQNEKVRHILFGIASWKVIGNITIWRFREWDGEKYQDIDYQEVVDVYA